jgi:hypothetical protein
MLRFALTLCLMLMLLLPAAAWSQREGALGPMMHDDSVMEPLSRAQVAQAVADHGYFEVDNLARQDDGSWTCTALVASGKRVALTIHKNGTIVESDLPPHAGH